MNYDDYDITFCNAPCPKAHSCSRALEYKRYCEDKSKNKPTFISMYRPDVVLDKCPMYSPVKGGIK